MLEKEVASIIKFILDSAGNPVPYYHNMPENFVVPSVYFPSQYLRCGLQYICEFLSQQY